MCVYVIQDNLGNFVSSDSIFDLGNEVVYVTHTGKADNLEYYITKEVAETKRTRLLELLQKYKINRSLVIKKINKELLKKGQIIKEYFKKQNS